ncbi:MAG: hypothetical protein ACRDD8_06015 [Bacteroidales bacterium]
MAIKKHNTVTGKWEVIAASDASELTLEHPNYQSKNIHSALSEIYEKLTVLRQNVTFLHRNSGSAKTFPYSLPIVLSSSEGDYIRTEEDGRQTLLIDKKLDADEVSAEEFNALVDVINHNGGMFFKMGSITVPTENGGTEVVELKTAEDIILFIQKYGVGLPSSNMKPKVVFEQNTFVFPQRGTIRVPFTIVDGEGGRFIAQFTLKGSDGSSSVYKFEHNDDYVVDGKKAYLSTGENAINIPFNIINPNNPASYRLTDFKVFDPYYVASEPVDVNILIGTISISEFTPPSLFNVGESSIIPVRYSSVVRNVSLHYKIQKTPIDGGAPVIDEENIDIVLPEDFSTTAIYSINIPVLPTRNDHMKISVYMYDTNTGGNVIKTKEITRQSVSLDENTIYVLPEFQKSIVDRYEPISFTAKILHQAKIQPFYDIEIESDGDVNTTITNIQSSTIEGLSVQADTQMSALTLYFKAIYKGSETQFTPATSSAVFTVNAPSYGSVDTGVSSVLWLDARGRSNNEPNDVKFLWKNKLKKNSQYVATISDIIDGANGWEQPSNGAEYTGNCLKLSAGAYATLPNIKPFSMFSNSNGVTFEVCMHSREASGLDTTLLSLGVVNEMDGRVNKQGIFITPKSIDVYMGQSVLSQPNSNDIVSYRKDGGINIDEEEYLHITIVFKRDGYMYEGKGLCLIYVNGIISNAMVMPDATTMNHNGYLILNGYDLDGNIKGAGTAKFRLVRIYDAPLSPDIVLQNYIASMYNSKERNVVVELNKDWSQGAIPLISKMYMEGDDTSMTNNLSVRMKWGFEKGRELELYGDNQSLAEFIPNPIGEDGVTPFENISAFTQWQGSSSLDYLVKNLDISVEPISANVDPMKFRMTREFPLSDSWQLKTNYIDSSGANNIAMAKLANQVWRRNWSNESLKTIQTYRDPEMTDPIYLNPMFRIQDTSGKIVTWRYPMYQDFLALNGFPYILYKDFKDKNSMNTFVRERFGGIMMCNLKQDWRLYGYESEKNSTDGVPSSGAWSRHIYYKHDNNGQSIFADELTAHIGQFDPRAIRNYSRNGKTYEDIRYKEFKGVKRSLEECLGFELLMCYEQCNPSNMGLGLRNGKDHTQWLWSNLEVSGESRESIKPFTNNNLWKYSWEFNNDSRYMYVIGSGKEPMRRINAQDEYTFNAISVENIDKYLIQEGNDKFLEWDKYAALSYHQNLEYINASIWASTCSDEDFSNPAIFNRYFRLDSCIDYVIMCMLFQLSDSLGRNLIMVSWDKQKPVMQNGQLYGYSSEDKHIFYPAFYDIDTSFGTDVYGSPSSPYLPWPHAIGRYEGVETRVQDLYWIECNKQIVEPSDVELVVVGKTRKSNSQDTTFIKDPIWKYAYFDIDGNEIGEPTDNMSIPNNAASIKVLVYNIIGTETVLLNFLHLPINIAGRLNHITTNESITRGKYNDLSFSWLVNNDNRIMTDQQPSVTIKSLNNGVSEVIQDIYIDKDGSWVELTTTPTKIDPYYPFTVCKKNNSVVFECVRKDDFNLMCQGDIVKIKFTTHTGYVGETVVDMRLNNSFEFSYNCVTNNLWRRICKHYDKAVVARYSELRKGYVDQNNQPHLPILTESNILDKYCTQIVNRIGEKYYNLDAFLKYFGSQFDSESEIQTKRAFVGNARGNKFLYVKDFLKKRMPYIDAMLGYSDETSATKGSIAIRHGFSGVMKLKIKSVAPAYITVQWVQNESTPVYLPGNDEWVNISYDYGDNVSSGQAWMKLLNCSTVSEIQGLSDKKIEKIEFNGTTALKRVDLSMNSFVQENPLSFIGCDNIEELSLANITGNGVAIGLKTESFPQLKRLDLSNSVVSANSLHLNKLLEYVNLSRNPFVVDVDLSNQKSIKVLKLTPYNIYSLDLSNSSIDIEIEEEDNRLATWSNLTSLKLNNNTGIRSLRKYSNSFEKLRVLEVTNCPNLVEFVGVLSNNNIITLDEVKLRKILVNCPLLKDVSNAFSRAGGVNGITIPSGFLSNLTSLTKASNVFSGSTINAIPSNLLSNNTALICVDGAFSDANIQCGIPSGFLNTSVGIKQANRMFSGASISGGVGDNFMSEISIEECSDIFRLASVSAVGSNFMYNTKPCGGVFAESSVVNIGINMFGGYTEEGVLSSMFEGCTNLISIGDGFLKSITKYSIQSGMFTNSSLQTLPNNFLRSLVGYTSFRLATILGVNSSIVKMNSDLLQQCVSLVSIDGLFNDTAIDEIPNNFLQDHVNITEFGNWSKCSIKKIGDNFLRDNTAIMDLSRAFMGTVIEEIGNNCFSNCCNINNPIGTDENGNPIYPDTSMANSMFAFSKIRRIGTNFLRYCGSIYQMFEGCSDLEFIGDGFYSMEIRCLNLRDAFKGCSAFKELPSGFASKLKNIVTFSFNDLFGNVTYNDADNRILIDKQLPTHAFCNSVVVDNYVYYIPFYHQEVMVLNIDTEEVTFIPIDCTQSAVQEGFFNNYVYVPETKTIYLIPLHHHNFVAINISDHNSPLVSYINTDLTTGTKFRCGVRMGDYIYAIPHAATHVKKINIFSETLVAEDVVSNASFKRDFGSVVVYRDHFVMCPINIATGSYVKYYPDQEYFEVVGSCKDVNSKPYDCYVSHIVGTKIYTMPYSATTGPMMEFDVNTYEMRLTDFTTKLPGNISRYGAYDYSSDRKFIYYGLINVRGIAKIDMATLTPVEFYYNELEDPNSITLIGDTLYITRASNCDYIYKQKIPVSVDVVNADFLNECKQISNVNYLFRDTLIKEIKPCNGVVSLFEDHPKITGGDVVMRFNTLRKVSKNMLRKANITSLGYAFWNNFILESIEDGFMSHLENCTSLYYFCHGASNLRSVPASLALASYGKITSIAAAYERCKSIQSTPINLFNDMPSLTSVNSLFLNAGSLRTVGAGFLSNCPKVSTASGLFQSTVVESVPDDMLSKSPLTTISYMFHDSMLKKIPSKLLDSSRDTLINMGYSFRFIKATAVPVGVFDNLTAVTDLTYAFAQSNISTLPAGFMGNSPELKVVHCVFCDCQDLKGVNADIFAASTKISDCSHIFWNCKNLLSVSDGFLLQTQNITTLTNAFYNTQITKVPDGFGSNCPDLTSINGVFHSSKVKIVNNTMFRNCPNITTIDKMFYMTRLEHLDDGFLSGLGTERWRGTVRDLNNLFRGTKIKKLPLDLVSAFPNIEIATSMFDGGMISEIPEGYFDGWRNSLIKINNFAYHVVTYHDDIKNPPYGWIEHIPNNMFNGFTKLENAYAFCYLSPIKTIGDNVFANCPKLNDIRANFGYDKKITNIGHNFGYNCPELEYIGFEDYWPAGQKLYIGDNFLASSPKCLSKHSQFWWNNDGPHLYVGDNFIRDFDGVETNTYCQFKFVEVGDNCFENWVNYGAGCRFAGTDMFAKVTKLGVNFFRNARNLEALYKSGSTQYAGIRFPNLRHDIPAGFMENCEKYIGGDVFANNRYISTIPNWLFAKNTKMKTTNRMFFGCSGLSGVIPDGFLQSHSEIHDFRDMFYGCASLTGNAPNYWITHPNANGTNAFYNAVALSNRNEIPKTWGGLLDVLSLEEMKSMHSRIAKLEQILEASLMENARLRGMIDSSDELK